LLAVVPEPLFTFKPFCEALATVFTLKVFAGNVIPVRFPIFIEKVWPAHVPKVQAIVALVPVPGPTDSGAPHVVAEVPFHTLD
jgi:hypothetical protein